MNVADTLERSVAQLVTDLKYDSISSDAMDAVRMLMEDQLALQIGCIDLPWNKAVLGMIQRSHAPGAAHITMAGPESYGPLDAAFVNATYGHSFEYDDHHPSASHPGSAVIPAALAVGEDLGATMGQVVVGMVAGYEVYTRIGNLISRELLRRGFHPHPILSVFGAAAVAAKMRGFDAETTQHALAIASSYASGLTEYTSSGGSVKRVHAGIGTKNGLAAADLAEAGITGPTKFLTGPKGFLKSFGGYTADAGTASSFGLDLPLEVARYWLKPYCCCGINHAYIDGARQLAEPHRAVESVVLRIQPSGNVVVGTSNENAYAPRTIDHLQYSLPYQFALSYLGYGNGFSTHHAYLNGDLDLGEHSAVAELARKVQILPDASLEQRYPHRWVGDSTVNYTDGGSRHVLIDKATGTPGNEMSQADVDAKFNDLVEPKLGPSASAALLLAIKELAPNQPIAEFARLLQKQTADIS